MPAGTVNDADHGATMPVTLLLEGGQVSLTMPQLKVQCAPRPRSGWRPRRPRMPHFIFATRAWPEAVPGRPVTEELLRVLVGEEETLTSAGHCVLPVRRLRK
ncbi:DUF5949 family protein [Streptomyces sp. NPDC023838]|uniref:DUF5949 family protein n=1 Tax=Streptomyces sp. NPDC023838 TaxID=3154325 RepID=UPI0033F5F8AD